MCAGAITAARISRLVFAAADPRAGAVGSLWDVIRDPRVAPWPEVIGGVLAEESLHNPNFFLGTEVAEPALLVGANFRYAQRRWSRLVAEGARLESV